MGNVWKNGGRVVLEGVLLICIVVLLSMLFFSPREPAPYVMPEAPIDPIKL